MIVSEYELIFDDFAAGGINISSLSDFKYLINDYFQTEKSHSSEVEIFEILELPAIDFQDFLKKSIWSNNN